MIENWRFERATYGPGIDQSQHAKSVSHIIIRGIDGSESQLVYNTCVQKVTYIAGWQLLPLKNVIISINFEAFKVSLLKISCLSCSSSY